MSFFQLARWFVRLTLAVVGVWACLSQCVEAQSSVPVGDRGAARVRWVRPQLLTNVSWQEDNAPHVDAPEQAEPEAANSCVSQPEMSENLAPITSITLDIGGKLDLLPNDCYTEHHPDDSTGSPVTEGRRSDYEYDFRWTPFGLVHNPLYFEDVPLERYGQGYSPLLQPAVSAVKFCGNVAILPYRIGLDPPYRLDYTLGYYRPGSRAPSVRPHLPWSWKGAALQAGAMTGFLYMFP